MSEICALSEICVLRDICVLSEICVLRDICVLSEICTLSEICALSEICSLQFDKPGKAESAERPRQIHGYDSSEKRRVPSFTDRIFFRGTKPMPRPGAAIYEVIHHAPLSLQL